MTRRSSVDSGAGCAAVPLDTQGGHTTNHTRGPLPPTSRPP